MGQTWGISPKRMRDFTMKNMEQNIGFKRQQRGCNIENNVDFLVK